METLKTGKCSFLFFTGVLLSSTVLVYWLTLVKQSRESVEFPLCSRGILDKSSYDYFFDSPNVAMKPVHQDPPCRLKHYSQIETVQCFDKILDKLRLKKASGKLTYGDTGEILMTFVGDSRIRQLYYELLKVDPFKNELVGAFHHDLTSKMAMFDERVTFQMIWSPIADHNMKKILTNWADSNYTNIPHLLLFGIGSHYAITPNVTSLDYEKNLKELYPILERLGKRIRERSNGKLIWMMQYQYYDRNINPKKFNNHYLEDLNSIARDIFRNSSVIQIWDSLLPIVDDYFRGCFEHNRKAPFMYRSWKDCNDNLHTGFAATTQAFQFLLNDWCNDVMVTE